MWGFIFGFVLGGLLGAGFMALMQFKKYDIEETVIETKVHKFEPERKVCADCKWYDPGWERCQKFKSNKHRFAFDDACSKYEKETTTLID